ncbi:MAG TPA: IS630 family transposase [Longimicrobium sp.]|nr:IS630 family transposase [Longimicrobium sp.]
MTEINPDDLVFVDESGIATDMVRLYARAEGGKRAHGTVPNRHYRKLTLLGGLSTAGLAAMMTIEAATNKAVFLAFVREVLVPELRPRQIVVLDNLRPHKDPAVRKAIEDAGCTIKFLPPYSPDFSPIEPCWSKLKTLLRGIGARTIDALEGALLSTMDRVSVTDARNWFTHCGYTLATN